MDLDIYQELFSIRQNTMLESYSFILGCGVSIPYGIQDWNSLLDSFRDAIIEKGLNPFKIEAASFNTNFGVFQILKDIDEERYYRLLTNAVIDRKAVMANGVSPTTLMAVVRYLANKSREASDGGPPEISALPPTRKRSVG